ncbi:MAG: universal stress protein [Actinobacteria bacterium]|nr:universal stress protein [Actinomycetota bacterium]
MFTRILFPTDFSSVSDLAAAYIHKLREAGAQEVLVLNVIDPSSLLAPAAPGPLGGVGATPAMNQRAVEEWRESAMEACGRLADEFSGVGFTATATVEVGDPAKIILRTARAENSKVIVVGAHGKGHVAEFFLGSVSDEVVRKSHVPVLVIKP